MGNDSGVFRLTAHSAGERLDRFLCASLPALDAGNLSRSYLQRLVEQHHVLVNGMPARPGQRLRLGDEVEVVVPPPELSEVLAQRIPIAIVYQDADLVVVDKPAGMVVHPAGGHRDGTLVNALLAAVPDLAGIGGTLRPGVVHRLDRDTSGLMVVAKTAAALEDLARQWKERRVHKAYIALVLGLLEQDAGVLEGPIGRDPSSRRRMAVVSGGKPARTPFRVLQRYRAHTLVEVRPETGRTHQVRVHFAAHRHPLYGDRLYGRPAPELARHFLHAALLGFALPSSGEYREFRSDLPAELRRVLSALGLGAVGGGTWGG